MNSSTTKPVLTRRWADGAPIPAAAVRGEVGALVDRLFDTAVGGTPDLMVMDLLAAVRDLPPARWACSEPAARVLAELQPVRRYVDGSGSERAAWAAVSHFVGCRIVADRGTTVEDLAFDLLTLLRAIVVG